MFTLLPSLSTVGSLSFVRCRTWVTRSVVAGAVAASLCLPSAGYAQEIDAGAFGEAIGKALQAAFEKQVSRMVKVSPALVKVDPVNKTAVFEIANEGTDTLEAELSMSNIAPNFAAGSKPAGSGLLAEDETPVGQDSIATSKSLQSWVKDLPAKVKIAPKEKKTITVKIDVPASAQSGEYAAWLVATTLPPKDDNAETTAETDDGGSITLKIGGLMKGEDGKPIKLQTGAKLTYVVDAK